MNIKLDKYEQEIEDNIENAISVSKKRKRELLKKIGASKKKDVHLRLSEKVIDEIREKAALKGINYQTLISSILHQYITDQLVLESDIIKAIDIIQNKDYQTKRSSVKKRSLTKTAGH